VQRDNEESTFIWEANGRERTKATAGGKGLGSLLGTLWLLFLSVAFLSDSEPAKLTKERLKGHRQLSNLFTDLVASTSY
jgi:hypothetical protein